jgi:hypothetical protein
VIARPISEEGAGERHCSVEHAGRLGSVRPIRPGAGQRRIADFRDVF